MGFNNLFGVERGKRFRSSSFGFNAILGERGWCSSSVHSAVKKSVKALEAGRLKLILVESEFWLIKESVHVVQPLLEEFLAYELGIACGVGKVCQSVIGMDNRTSASRPSSSLADLRDWPENALVGRHVCAVSYSARIIKMRVERSKLHTQDKIKKFEIESSAAHWTQLDCATSLDLSLVEANRKYFESLQWDPQLRHFFKDFRHLVVGEKIAEGVQVDIYEVVIDTHPEFPTYNHVVKVVKGDVPMQSFQSQWPLGMLSAQSMSKDLSGSPLISIRGGTLLQDKRLKGRFAFLMPRQWDDLQKLIDEHMV